MVFPAFGIVTGCSVSFVLYQTGYFRDSRNEGNSHLWLALWNISISKMEDHAHAVGIDFSDHGTGACGEKHK